MDSTGPDQEIPEEDAGLRRTKSGNLESAPASSSRTEETCGVWRATEDNNALETKEGPL